MFDNEMRDGHLGGPLHVWVAEDDQVHVAVPDAATFLCGAPVSGRRSGGGSSIPFPSCEACYSAEPPR